MRNRRKPFYPDDNDYTTNSPSYYDDLARKQKLIQLLAEKIWEYDKKLHESLEEVERVLAEVINKIGIGFNQEINDLLILWVEDGTLDHIINVTLMNKKADITYVDQLISELNILMNQELENLNTTVQDDLTQMENKITDDLIEVNTKTNKRIDYLVTDWNMTQLNIQKRHRVNDQSYSAVQGACYLGGSGIDLQYALAFIPIDKKSNDAIILTTKADTPVAYTGGNVINVYHGNALDLNGETNTLYVAHANTQLSGGGSEYNNEVSEVTKDGRTILRVLTPKGLPVGRRVKYYSYDKITQKHYLGDDYGVYEVDKELNVLKTIDFSQEFLNHKNWGLGQATTVHNDLIFYLVSGYPTIAVFDITGKLLMLHEIPKFSKNGVFTGSSPNALFFDMEDNLYLVGGSDYSSYKMDDFITRVFKMNPFKSISTDDFVGTHNTKTANNIYVDPNHNSPISNGSSAYPFISLDEAVTYALTSDYQKGFQTIINLKAGRYASSDLRTNGAKLIIQGEAGVKIDALRLYSTDVSLIDVEIDNPDNSYTAVHLNNSSLAINGVKVDAKGKTSGYFIEQGSVLSANVNGGKTNSIINCDRAIYNNSSLVIGSKEQFGIATHPRPIVGNGFTPQF